MKIRRIISLVYVLFVLLTSWSVADETRGPYLTELTSTTATVMFHTYSDQAVELRMYENEYSTPIKIATSNGKAHEFHLENLKSETPYRYKIFGIESGAELTRNHQFTTRKRNISKFSFIVYGDSRDQNPEPKRHKQVTRNFLSHDPLFIVHTGDLLLGGQNQKSAVFNRDWLVNFFEPLEKVIDQVPFHMASGNHDEDAIDAESTLKSVFPVYEESFHYAFTVSDVHFIFLHVPNQMKQFQSEKEWFIGELVKARDYAWRIVFLHVSPVTNGKYRDYQWTLEGRDDFFRTCLDHKVDLVFSGHDHSYQRFFPLKQKESDTHAVQFLVTALAGTNPYHADENEFTAKIVNKTDHYCVVKVAPETLTISAHNNENKPFDEFVLSKERTDIVKVFRLNQ